jgi:hypothetical protein
MEHRWLQYGVRTLSTAAVLGSTCGATAQTAGPALSNQPPEWTQNTSNEQEVRTGNFLHLAITATDPDGDPLTFVVGELPEGAQVRWTKVESERRSDGMHVRYFSPVIEWQTKATQYGSFDIPVTVSDGKITLSRTIRVYIEEQWETFLMPGLNFRTWFPVANDSLGMLYGPSAEFLLAGWIHRNKNRGPSHVRIYAGLGLLGSTRKDVAKAVNLNLGFNLSIERNPVRRAMIPYFGMETGVMIDSTFGRPGYFVPLIGVHIWADRNLFVNLDGGYLFPTHDVDSLRGYHAKFGLDFALW